MGLEGLLEGRTVLVTGAARGIGQGVARAVTAAGSRVALLDLETTGVLETASALEAEGHEALALGGDVTDETSVRGAVVEILARFGALHGVVNNAGALRMAPALETEARDARLQYDVNVHAVLLVSRIAASVMIERGTGGAIVNVASNAGKVGYPNMAAYNASKAAVISLTRSLAAEWAEHGINVNAVCPGGVRTEMLERVAEWIAPRAGLDPAALLDDMVPAQLGRHIEPIEIGRVVAFLLSGHATVIRGQAINTDGGDTPY